MSRLLKRYSCKEAIIQIDSFGEEQMIVTIVSPEKHIGKFLICSFDELLINCPSVKGFLREKVCSNDCSFKQQELFPCSEN